MEEKMVETDTPKNKENVQMKDEALAEEFKTKGNDAFKNGQFQEAVDFYSKAIQNNPDNEFLFTNRAASLISLKRYSDALCDC
mmetsp:Transcript_2838/g.2662  ORF Transcript_2838/g.2662 Transcript_2838/m.2662 type:complete len:83 (+) Transcript_2838:1-249(+)